MNTIDLQIQSTASDGKHAPRELVEMAKEMSLKVIAITDHDTVGGVAEALLAGGEFGVRVIPGIEMSVEERGTHILGYGIDYQSPALLEELEKFKQGRAEGAKKMVENLKGAGFTVEWEDVLKEATGGIVARPHIVRAILGRAENKEKLGDISTVHDFIQKYLADDSPYYIKRSHISAKNAIELLHHAGAVAIWSHPAIHFQNDYEGLENFLNSLREWEVDGVEVFTPSHTEDDTEFLNSLATKYNLLRIAGSDFHERGLVHRGVPVEGGFATSRSAVMVGDYETFGFSTEGIVEKLDEAIAARRGKL